MITDKLQSIKEHVFLSLCSNAVLQGREPHPVAPVDPAAMSHLEHKMEQNSLASPPEDSVQSTDTHA